MTGSFSFQSLGGTPVQDILFTLICIFFNSQRSILDNFHTNSVFLDEQEPLYN